MGTSLFLSQFSGMQVAPYLRHVILPSVACLAVTYFAHYLTNSKIFGTINLLNIKSVIPLLIPTWYTIFYINYIKLSSPTCFERHPLIFRRSMMLIVHVCKYNIRLYNFTLWHTDSPTQCYTTTHSSFLFNKMITYSKYNKAIIHFYRMRIPEATYIYT